MLHVFVCLINSYCPFFIFRFYIFRFSMTTLLELGVLMSVIVIISFKPPTPVLQILAVNMSALQEAITNQNARASLTMSYRVTERRAKVLNIKLI